MLMCKLLHRQACIINLALRHALHMLVSNNRLGAALSSAALSATAVLLGPCMCTLQGEDTLLRMLLLHVSASMHIWWIDDCYSPPQEQLSNEDTDY